MPLALVAWIDPVTFDGLGCSLSPVVHFSILGPFLDFVSYNGPVCSFRAYGFVLFVLFCTYFVLTSIYICVHKYDETAENAL